jgi:hypothetical protein
MFSLYSYFYPPEIPNPANSPIGEPELAQKACARNAPDNTSLSTLATGVIVDEKSLQAIIKSLRPTKTNAHEVLRKDYRREEIKELSFKFASEEFRAKFGIMH